MRTYVCLLYIKQQTFANRTAKTQLDKVFKKSCSSFIVSVSP
ncbi:hypothetical protein B4146_1963 [Bacillus subtilis]|uniref:Uncharacterized protein n=1 Tax=Bacillus subtilis TaxID=1423 RepID=A0AAP1HA62_BACIU|nr:hypothetical protein B4146_1963 [Bacillus subtilis]KZD95153.1 hypothetical protein B4122_0125 [Bacillus subtilis]